jgi:AI-2 transport protein TqsA
VLLGTAGAVVTVAGMRGIGELLGPVFLALMLTVAVHPLIGWLRRHGTPGWLAVTVTVLVLMGMLLSLAGALAVSVGELASLLPAYQSQFQGLVNQLTAFLASHGIGPQQVRTALSRVDFSALTAWFAGLLGAVAAGVSNLFFILALLLFMGVDAAQFPARLRSVSGERPDGARAFSSFASGTRSYLIVSTVFGAIVAVIDGVALWLLGVPLPVLWGLLAFITNYIPNIGFLIGGVPPALLALLEDGPQLMAIVIVVYSVINFVIQSVIQPKYVGDSVDLALTLTFLSLVFWSWVIGGLGAILAIPLTLMVKALLVDIDPDTRWLAALISSGPPKEPVDRDIDVEAETALP